MLELVYVEGVLGKLRSVKAHERYLGQARQLQGLFYFFKVSLTQNFRNPKTNAFFIPELCLRNIAMVSGHTFDSQLAVKFLSI